MKIKLKLIITAILMMAVSNPAFSGKRNDTLNIVWSGELATLDRYFNTLREAIPLSRMIYDTLLFKDPDTLEYKPLLAKSYRFVDETAIEFTLREGVTFHNGEAFDADDVVYTLNFVSNPDNKVQRQQNVRWIDKVTRLDKYTVRLTMKAPTPTALEFLAGELFIYPNEYYAKVGPEGMGKNPVGTGPYKVASFNPSVSATFVRNENYFTGSPKGKAKIKNVVQRTVPDQNTQIAELLSGRADWIWKVKTDQAEKLKELGKVAVASAPTLRIGYLVFDSSNRTGNNSPVNNVKVRKAIAHAIDRQAIVDALIGEGSGVVHSACHPEQFGCESKVTKYEYNPQKAKKLLAEAGYPNGFSIDFHAYRNINHAEAMMGQLQAVGIKPSLVRLKYAALRDKVQAGKVDFAFMTWGSSSMHDISAITSHFFKATRDDYARDQMLVEALTRGDESVDPAARKKAYSEALKRIANNVYWLPLYVYPVNYAFSNNLNFTPNADEVPRFYRASWQ